MSRSRRNDGTRNTWRSPLQAASEFLASARLCPTFTGLAIGAVAKMTTYTYAYLVNRLLSRSPGGTKELLTSHNLTKSGSRKSKNPAICGVFKGALGRTRTCDLLIRSLRRRVSDRCS